MGEEAVRDGEKGMAVTDLRMSSAPIDMPYLRRASTQKVFVDRVCCFALH